MRPSSAGQIRLSHEPHLVLDHVVVARASVEPEAPQERARRAVLAQRRRGEQREAVRAGAQRQCALRARCRCPCPASRRRPRRPPPRRPADRRRGRSGPRRRSSRRADRRRRSRRVGRDRSPSGTPARAPSALASAPRKRPRRDSGVSRANSAAMPSRSSEPIGRSPSHVPSARTSTSEPAIACMVLVSSRPSGARCRGLDVLVQPEHVRRVVLVLERDQAGVRLLAVRRPRCVRVAEEVDVRAAGRRVGGRRDDGARPLPVRAGAASSCQPVTALSTNGIERSANAVAPSATRPTAPPIWWTWISHCGPGAARWISQSRSMSSSSSRARFVALK